MDEGLSVIQSTGKTKVTELKHKPSVSMERETKTTNVKESAIATELRRIEVEVEETEHAFALVTEIREKIESAHRRNLSLKGD